MNINDEKILEEIEGNLDKLVNTSRWIGFGLGILASIVIELVAYVVYTDYFK